VTERLIIQNTPPCRPEVVKEITGGFARLGEKATDVLRRVEERPGFPGATARINNPILKRRVFPFLGIRRRSPFRGLFARHLTVGGQAGVPVAQFFYVDPVLAPRQ
jgi:hypothetical protein